MTTEDDFQRALDRCGCAGLRKTNSQAAGQAARLRFYLTWNTSERTP
jgi:hypothetical protein